MATTDDDYVFFREKLMQIFAEFGEMKMVDAVDDSIQWLHKYHIRDYNALIAMKNDLLYVVDNVLPGDGATRFAVCMLILYGLLSLERDKYSSVTMDDIDEIGHTLKRVFRKRLDADATAASLSSLHYGQQLVSISRLVEALLRICSVASRIVLVVKLPPELRKVVSDYSALHQKRLVIIVAEGFEHLRHGCTGDDDDGGGSVLSTSNCSVQTEDGIGSGERGETERSVAEEVWSGRKRTREMMETASS